MRNRPVRPNIFLDVCRFGVVVGDLKYILVATVTGYLIPFFLGLKIGVVPLGFFGAIGAAAASYAFFRYARFGRRSHWCQHKFRALIDGPSARRTLPGDRAGRPFKSWLLEPGQRN